MDYGSLARAGSRTPAAGGAGGSTIAATLWYSHWVNWAADQPRSLTRRRVDVAVHQRPAHVRGLLLGDAGGETGAQRGQVLDELGRAGHPAAGKVGDQLGGGRIGVGRDRGDLDDRRDPPGDVGHQLRPAQERPARVLLGPDRDELAALIQDVLRGEPVLAGV